MAERGDRVRSSSRQGKRSEGEKKEKKEKSRRKEEDYDAFLDDNEIQRINQRSAKAPESSRQMPKRPSSRADSRPRDADVRSSGDKAAKPPRPSDSKSRVRPSAAPAGAGLLLDSDGEDEPIIPAKKEKDKKEKKEKKEPKPEAPPPAPAPEVKTPRKEPQQTLKPKPAKPAMPSPKAAEVDDEEINPEEDAAPDGEYEDDFEDVETDEEANAVATSSEESYQAAHPSRPTSAGVKQEVNRVVIPRKEKPRPDEQLDGLDELKKAMMQENSRSRTPGGPSGSPTPVSGKQQYETRTKVYKQAATTDSAQAKRIAGLKNIGVFQKRTQETFQVHYQRPLRPYELFRDRKTAAYANMTSVASQCQISAASSIQGLPRPYDDKTENYGWWLDATCGDEQVEQGVQTEDVWKGIARVQCPVLVVSSSDDAAGNPRLLPFLRRVAPLFEGAMNEAREGQVVEPEEDASSPTSRGTTLSLGATLRMLPDLSAACPDLQWRVVHVTLCPEWCGADYALMVVSPSSSTVFQGEVEAGGAMGPFLRKLRSVIHMYELRKDDGTAAGTERGPSQLLYSFSDLTSVATVPTRPHLVVAGSTQGVVIVWDLRVKPARPEDIIPLNGPETSESLRQLRGLPSAGGSSPAKASGEAPELSPELAQSLWYKRSASTDGMTFARGDRGLDEDGAPKLEHTIHTCEIVSVKCPDGVQGEAVVFALDCSGLASIWRILERETSLNLQPVGTVRAGGTPDSIFSADFLGATSISLQPQQAERFAVASECGLYQASRRVDPTDISMGPRTMDNSATSACAFNPFLPGLLLVAYFNGDLALWDQSLCVPITQWPGAISYCRGTASVAWSTVRAAVFAVKHGVNVDVWDLMTDTLAPVSSIQLPPAQGGDTKATSGSVMFSGAGHLVVGSGTSAYVIQVPKQLTVPLTTFPSSLPPTTSVDELIVDREKYSEGMDLQLPTLEILQRDLKIPIKYKVEAAALRQLLASIPAYQAEAGLFDLAVDDML
mmetsp:Transcript_51481/g.135899  ORF Transcript_51481/g.135899 Transcript_51481/m.135899 type:complete len:1004 (-) Transcript_51481:158-3169(-)